MSIEALLNLVKFSFMYLYFTPFFFITYKVFFKWGIKKSWWLYTMVIAGYIFTISIVAYEVKIGLL